MAYYDSGAVEGAYGFLEDVLRRHIEVVGRLVEDKQVDGLKQQSYHCQTAALTAGEHLDALLGLFAAKHKGAENVVDAQTDVTFGNIVYGLEHRQRLVQELCLVLRKVAYLHVMAYLQRAVEWYLAHNALHEC